MAPHRHSKLDLDAFTVEPPTEVAKGEALVDAMRASCRGRAGLTAFLAVTRRASAPATTWTCSPPRA